MKKLFKHMNRQDFMSLGLIVIFIIFQVYLDLKLPDYMSEITLLIKSETSSMNDILFAGSKMLFCALGALIFMVCTSFFASRLGASVSMRLRGKVFDKVLTFSLEEINTFSTSSLINRTTNDITQIQMFITMGLQAALKAPFIATWAIIKISTKSFEWTLATAVAVLLLLFMIGVILVVAVPRFKKIQKLSDEINKVARENLTGIRVVRAYNAEEYQNDKFNVANDNLTNNNLVTNRTLAIIHPSMSFISNALNVSIYVIGAILINSALVSFRLEIFSDMVVFLSYAMQVLMSFMMMTILLIQFPRAEVSLERISEVLETNPKIIDKNLPKVKDTNSQYTVEFNNVTFNYPDSAEPVLSNISFKAKKGQTIALIGSAGSGKSTLINLIARFYDATSGEILINGINIKDYNLEDLYNKIGYVSQKAVIFSGSIKSNVTFGDCKATDFDIDSAIKTSQSSEFVSKMENGYDAEISQSGLNLSGGQKQRLSIARAIAKNPEIYIFDDSFSALDYKTDRILRKELKPQTKNATTFIVAQRIGTIRDADAIIVLEDGLIAGLGTHKELLEHCEVYKEIAYSQLSKEELL